MTNITFPAFNINLSISRTAFTIGGIHIYWYAIFIAVAILIAILALKKIVKIQYKIQWYIRINDTYTTNSNYMC